MEPKYKHEKKGIDKFLTFKFFEFKISDDMPIMDQVHELDVLVSQLSELQIVVPDTLQARAILSKLPPSWHNYRKKIMHSIESFTIEQVTTHMQIEATNRAREAMILSSTFKKMTYTL